jgi:hypothetical protein
VSNHLSDGPPVRLRLGPPRSRPSSSGSRSGRSAIRANSLRDPRSVRPTAAVRCAEVRSASRPAGHAERGWSDNVSADVERTPDATSSSQNLTQTFRSRRPRIPSLNADNLGWFGWFGAGDAAITRVSATAPPAARGASDRGWLGRFDDDDRLGWGQHRLGPGTVGGALDAEVGASCV